MPSKQQLTRVAGKATAAAVRALNTKGLTDETRTAVLDAAELTDQALAAGATPEEIRDASGLDRKGR